MNYEESEMKEAFTLYHKLLVKGKIEKREDAETYRFYFSPRVRDIFQNIILPIAKVRVFNVDETIYLMPDIDNDIFSYTNEELRNLMKLNSNKELYTVQFIWLNVISEFYGEQFQLTNESRTYVKVEMILRKVNEYINQFKQLNDEELFDLSVEYEMDLEGLVGVWESLGKMTEDVKDYKKATKRDYGFVLKALSFWENEKLLIIRNDDEIVLTEKMKQMAGQFYHHEERINQIKELLNKVK